jgi:2-polyprenyl-6-methoxyphenol hydroxylase-like FAD-dependent oxidoreductase
MTGPARILVAGAGSAGLALALQAHEHGADVRIIDRRREAFLPSRALIMHARTLEVLRPLAVTQALLGRADTAPAVDLHLGGRVVRIRLADLALPATAFPHLALIRQMDVETGLAAALADRGVEVERGTELLQVAKSPGAHGRFCGRGPRPRRPTSVSSPAATVISSRGAGSATVAAYRRRLARRRAAGRRAPGRCGLTRSQPCECLRGTVCAHRGSRSPACC